MLFFSVQKFDNGEPNGAESDEDECRGGGGEEMPLIDEAVGACA